MEIRITATQAARQFSDLLNRVRYRSEEFIIERNGEPIGRLAPAEPGRITVREAVEALRTGPQPDSHFAADVRRARRQFRPRVPKSAWPS